MTLWWMLAAAPLALVVVVLCIREPMRLALPLYAALLPFGSGLSVVSSSSFGSLSSLAGVLLGVGLVAQLIGERRAARSLSLSVPIWLSLLGAACASVLWTIDRSTTVGGIMVLASLVLVYVLVAMSHADRVVLRRTENGLLVGGVAVVAYGLYQLLVEGGFPSDVTGATSPDGRFGNGLLGPGIQAVTLLLPLTIALHRAFAEAARGRQLRYTLVALLMFCGILMTGSRTGTLAVAVVVLAMAWAGPRHARPRFLATLLVAIVAAGAVWVFQPAGVASRTFESPTSSSGRTDIWRVGLSACDDYCLAGSGWGTFPQVYAETQASVPDARVLVGEGGSYQPHNLWLLAVIELGVVGLVLLTWGLGHAALDAWRLPRDRRGPPFAVVLGLCFAVVFLSSMEFKFFWMVLIMVALNRNVTEHEQSSEEVLATEATTGTAV